MYNYISDGITEDMKVGGVIGKLSADKFINVAVAMNVKNNTFTVYVNGTKGEPRQSALARGAFFGRRVFGG